MLEILTIVLSLTSRYGRQEVYRRRENFKAKSL